MILNAKDANIIVNGKDAKEINSLPHVGVALHAWMKFMLFGTICKQNIDGRTQEIESKIQTHAVRQPLSAEQLKLKPEGLRSWKWDQLHALPDLVLNTDDRVTYGGITFRVQYKKDWAEYGYIEYHVVQDFGYLNESPEYA